MPEFFGKRFNSSAIRIAASLITFIFLIIHFYIYIFQTLLIDFLVFLVSQFLSEDLLEFYLLH